MKPRNPQLALRLDAAAPDQTARWRDGAPLAYLGGTVILRLDTDCKEAQLAAGELHLPLPPEAGPRQIQDATESWLRARALRMIAEQVSQSARVAGRPAPTIALSFAARTDWTQVDTKDGEVCLRVHWRLIEQAQTVIAEVLTQAVARLPRWQTTLDLFALA
jgi:predicted metal-dependent hydrolase